MEDWRIALISVSVGVMLGFLLNFFKSLIEKKALVRRLGMAFYHEISIILQGAVADLPNVEQVKENLGKYHQSTKWTKKNQAIVFKNNTDKISVFDSDLAKQIIKFYDLEESNSAKIKVIEERMNLFSEKSPTVTLESMSEEFGQMTGLLNSLISVGEDLKDELFQKYGK